MTAARGKTRSRRIVETFFGDLSALEGTHEHLADHLEWVRLPRGAVLFRQGDPGDALYLVVSGTLSVLAEDGNGPPRLLTTLGEGALVGEVSLITGRARTATIEAASTCEVVRLPRAAFDRLLDEHPQAMMPLIRMLVQRLEHREEVLVTQVVQLTVQIDEARRSRAVREIAESGLFADLQEKARRLRARRRT